MTTTQQSVNGLADTVVRLSAERDAARDLAVQLEQQCADLIRRIEFALVWVNTELHCDCFYLDHGGEFAPEPCLRCTLRNELVLPSPFETVVGAG